MLAVSQIWCVFWPFGQFLRVSRASTKKFTVWRGVHTDCRWLELGKALSQYDLRSFIVRRVPQRPERGEVSAGYTARYLRKK